MMMRADAACAVLNPAQSRVPKNVNHAQDVLISSSTYAKTPF